jgi:predicted nuclease of predicted toxin-antitoxin system
VRILLDEQLPRRLARELAGHDVRTVQQEGWAGVKNGELVRRAAEAGFEIFLTADQNLQFQQNLKHAGLGVVVLTARSNRLQDLLPLLPQTLGAIRQTRPGQLTRIAAPRSDH